VSAGAVTLPQGARELLDAREPAVLATVDSDGSPRMCVMWVARDGDHLLMSTRSHRRQYSNLQRDARASVLVYSRPLPRRYVHIRGRAELGGEGADELIRELSQAHLGVPHSPSIDYGERALIRIIPDHVALHD
jgi:PPOX class probable F420-dependent enzyme